VFHCATYTDAGMALNLNHLIVSAPPCSSNSQDTVDACLGFDTITEKYALFISNFCHVLNAVCFLLHVSPLSEVYMPTFRNTPSVPSSQAAYEDGNERV
jgi:hypothetical protein